MVYLCVHDISNRKKLKGWDSLYITRGARMSLFLFVTLLSTTRVHHEERQKHIILRTICWHWKTVLFQYHMIMLYMLPAIIIIIIIIWCMSVGGPMPPHNVMWIWNEVNKQTNKRTRLKKNTHKSGDAWEVGG